MCFREINFSYIIKFKFTYEAIFDVALDLSG